MAGDLKTQIAVGVDGSGVTAGVDGIKKTLDTLGQKATQVGKQAADGIDGIGAAAAPTSSKVEAATKNMIGSIQRQIAVMEAGSRSGADYYRALAGQRGIDANALKPYLDQLDAITAKQKTAQAALQGTPAALNQVGVSAAQTAAALRGVPAQFTDIVTSLQGGQSPITVFLQQGGQLKDMFGGAGAAASALGGYVASLVNPFTLGAAALGAIAYAAYDGAKEMTAYSRALILTGSASGKTAGDLQAMARQIAATAGTQSQAAEALTSAVSSGKIAAGALESVGDASVRMSRVLGISIDDAVGQFAKLADEPTKASAKLNEQYNYLSASTYQRIRDLEEQGQKEAAVALAQSTLADATIARMKQVQEQAGILSRALGGVGDVASGMWKTISGAISSIGAQQTSTARIMDAQRKVSYLEANGSTPQALADARGELDAANESDRLAKRSALMQAENARSEAEKTAAIERWEAMRKSNRTQAQIRQELIDQTIADGKRLGKAQKDIDDEIANINAKHKDPKSAAVKAYQDDADTKYVQQLREQEAALQTRLAVGEKLTGAAKELAEFEQKIADLKDKGSLTKDQKDLLGRQNEIRALLQEIGLLEKLGLIEDEEAKKKTKLAQEAVAFQNRAAQLQEQIANSQAERRDGYARTLGGFGKSDNEQQRIQEVNGLYRESLRLQDQLTKATPKDLLGSEDYRTALASIQGSLSISLADHAKYYADLKKMQGDWSLGAKSALATYAEDSANVARQMQQATGRAFQGMEDQLVSLVTTGKASFKGLIDSITADVARLTIRQNVTGPLAGYINGLLGGGTTNIAGGNLSNSFIKDVGVGRTGLVGMSEGGYTGPGGKYQPAGLVHAGEYVINADSTRKLGLDFLGKLNGYADGGYVSPPPAVASPNYGALAAMRSGGGSIGKIEVNVQNHASAAKAEVRQTQTPDGVRIDVILEAVDDYLGDKIAYGQGSTARAVEGRYGLRTTVS